MYGRSSTGLSAGLYTDLTCALVPQGRYDVGMICSRLLALAAELHASEPAATRDARLAPIARDLDAAFSGFLRFFEVDGAPPEGRVAAANEGAWVAAHFELARAHGQLQGWEVTASGLDPGTCGLHCCCGSAAAAVFQRRPDRDTCRRSTLCSSRPARWSR